MFSLFRHSKGSPLIEKVLKDLRVKLTKKLYGKQVHKEQFSPPGACLYCIRCCVCIVCIVVFVVVHTLLSGTKKLDAKKKGKGKGKNKDSWV